jgi:hypothetical protein
MPYAPGITYHGDQNLAAGISSFGESLGKMAEQRKQDARKATLLRGLWAAYKPDEKDVAATKSLPELEGMVQGAAVQQHMAEQQGLDRLRQAQAKNLEADNTRADLNQQLLMAQGERSKRRDANVEGFNKLVAKGPPMVLRPDLARDYSGELGRIRYAMSKFPGGVPAEVFQTLARVAAESEDPNRQALAESKLNNSKAALKNSEKDKSGLTENQRLADEDRNRALDIREAATSEASIRSELKQLDENFSMAPDAKEARRNALYRRLDSIRAGKRGGYERPAGFSMEAFKDWSAKQK